MTTKTIALAAIPLPDRLGYARKIANGETVKYLGLTVTNEPTNAAAKADALSAMPATYRLTQARLSAAPKKPEQPTATARRGACLVEDADGKILGFYPGEPA